LYKCVGSNSTLSFYINILYNEKICIKLCLKIYNISYHNTSCMQRSFIHFFNKNKMLCPCNIMSSKKKLHRRYCWDSTSNPKFYLSTMRTIIMSIWIFDLLPYQDVTIFFQFFF
jgi:hypothetical protein